MKKIFMEPKMRKIELNLSENIAESKPISEDGFYFWHTWDNCHVQYTNKFIYEGVGREELALCRVNAAESTSLRGKTIVPEEQVRMFLKY